MHPTTRRLLTWYRAHGRVLPWRSAPGPYRTWLSEIMLQQTRVETVIPYYQRFLERFPTVWDLAAAPLDDVLGLWAGLGYYRRARNLHRAAVQVVELGGFPTTEKGLRGLAGVGEYTAAAIASIALGLDAVAVDGNLRRVVARLAAIERVVHKGEGATLVRRWLLERLPSGRAGDFNQALMDLGATVCLPRNPHCERCPLAEDCRARAADLVSALPVTAARVPPRPVRAVAVLLEFEGRVLLRQRDPEGLLGGLWGPPDRVLQPDESEPDALTALLTGLAIAGAGAPRSVADVEHVFTHQHWRVAVYQLALEAPVALDTTLCWWRLGVSDGPPLSRLAEKLLECLD